MARSQALRVAARADRPHGALLGVGARAAHWTRDLLVLRADPRVRRVSDSGHRRWAGPNEPTRQRDQVARRRSLLPLVHVPVHPDPVRRPRVRLLAVVQRRALDPRRHRAGAHDGDGQRDRDQHRPRASRAQARQHGALAEPRRARPERLWALLHRAQSRPPRARRHPRGPRQRAHGGELLRLPPAHRCGQPALGLGSSSARACSGWIAASGRRATTSSAPGR